MAPEQQVPGLRKASGEGAGSPMAETCRLQAGAGNTYGSPWGHREMQRLKEDSGGR